MTHPALTPAIARNLAVRLALTEAITRWRADLGVAERLRVSAVEDGDAYDIDLYTDMVLRLQGDIKHVADALREMP